MEADFGGDFTFFEIFFRIEDISFSYRNSVNMSNDLLQVQYIF